MNNKAIKLYGQIVLIALFVLFLFVYLEKNEQKYAIELSSKNALTQQTIQLLQSLVDEKSVVFEIYAQPHSLLANKIRDFFIPYLRYNPVISLEFVDPSSQPAKVQENAISMQGEIVLSFKDQAISKQVHMTELSESALVNALMNLQNNKDEWLVFAEGYGMRQIDDESDLGLSTSLLNLKKIGLKIARMPLTTAVKLPDNVKAIVLAAPTETLDAEIVDWLMDQRQRGVSLWWMSATNGSSQALLEIAFEVMLGDKLSNKEDMKYVSHAITKNFNQPLFMPDSIEIISDNSSSFIQSSKDKSLAVARDDQLNRLLVMGNVDFISNQYVNSAANKNMLMRVVDWLLYHDDRANIALKVNKHTQLWLSEAQWLAFSVFFLIIVPLLFLLIAFKQWRNNRAG